MKTTQGTGHIAYKRVIAYLIVCLENISAVAWPVFSWVFFYCGLWLLSIPALLGAPGQYFAWVTFILGFSFFIHRAYEQLVLPSKNDIDRRLEKDSGIKHRPLEQLGDLQISGHSDLSRSLWRQNKIRAFHTLKNIKFPKIRPIFAGRDIYALRFLTLLMVCLGLFLSGSNSWEKIRSGLMPFHFQFSADQFKTASITIIPPKYTSLGETHITARPVDGVTIKIPQGSMIKAKLTDGLTHPKFHFDNTATPMNDLGHKSWNFESEIVEGDHIQITQWPRTVLTLPYEFIPDTPPQIGLSDEPKDIDNGKLSIPLEIQDDYGARKLYFTAELEPGTQPPLYGKTYEDTRAIYSPPAVNIELPQQFDLAWHPWAGLPVVIHISVTDDLDQKADLPPIHISLPEKIFTDPVAKEIVELRKKMMSSHKTPLFLVAADLQKILDDPEKLKGNFAVTLAMQSAVSRLLYSTEDGKAQKIITQLWDIALTLEDGNLSQATQNLQTAQQNLRETLSSTNATDEEIAAAIDQMRQAMAEYMMESFKEYQKQLAEQGHDIDIPTEMLQNMVEPKDLESFLNELMARAMAGDKNAAQDMLSQLDKFMNKMGSMKDFQLSDKTKFQMKGISDLQRLIEQQEALLRQTEGQIPESAKRTPNTSRKQSGQDSFTIDLSDPNRPFIRKIKPRIPQGYPEFVPFDNEDEAEASGGDSVFGEDTDMPPPPKITDKDTGTGKAQTPEEFFKFIEKEDRAHRHKQALKNKNEEQRQQRYKQNAPPVDTAANKVEQDALRYTLGQLMLEADEKMGKIPQPMQLAEQEMRFSAEALGANDPYTSVPHQEKAIEYLKESMDQMSKELQQTLQNMTFFSFGGGQGKTDPLGRRIDDEGTGDLNTSTIEIPDKHKRKQVQDILNKLRKKSGEFNRPDYELEYYKRLMQQF